MPPINYATFEPADLGKKIRLAHRNGLRDFVTVLVGAGFSRSAGIPLAGEIVRELRNEEDPFLQNAGAPPEGVSEYAFLMDRLGGPKERSDRVKRYVKMAEDKRERLPKRLQINWAHLLLATMVGKGYINRILTTNFDPLIVEALAITGQSIRTYDLNTTRKYDPGTLDPASVIYLHGQMHSLYLANSPDEMRRIEKIYPPVLQEALQNSFLIVVGYSGECDPVLQSLSEMHSFPRGLWWSHFSPKRQPPGAGVDKLFQLFGTDCHLATGDDADTFMRKLVVDGMKLDLPGMVLRPIPATRGELERITAFPTNSVENDPVRGALELLRFAEEAIRNPNRPPPADGQPAAEKPTPALGDMAQIPMIEMAALRGDWKAFDRLRGTIPKDPTTAISRAIGNGLLRRVAELAGTGDLAAVRATLSEAEAYGISDENRPWIPVTEGNVLSDLAKTKAGTPEADRLFAEAGEKYAEAISIDPAMYEAYVNWGIALSDQAMTKGNIPEADELYAKAGEKYAKAIAISSNRYDAFFNWGNTLSEHAKTKGNTAEAKILYTKAGEKYAKAVAIKPDKHEAYFNWGNALYAQARIQGDTSEADALFREAGAKFAKAAAIKPDKHEAFNNWGNALSDQAKLNGDTPEADALFLEAGVKYAEALRIKPDKHDALFNWGVAFYDQAKIKTDPSVLDLLFTEALNKFEAAVRIKPDKHWALFYLACISSLKNDVVGAVAALDRWHSVRTSATKSLLDKEADFDRIRTAPEFVAFRAKLPD